MESGTFAIGQLVEKICLSCGVEQSHTVTVLTKKGLISKVACTSCATVSSFKSGVKAADDGKPKTGSPYDPKLTYRKGQAMMHNSFGYGEVMSIIEPQKIDVKFSDRLRRLIHARN